MNSELELKVKLTGEGIEALKRILTPPSPPPQTLCEEPVTPPPPQIQKRGLLEKESSASVAGAVSLEKGVKFLKMLRPVAMVEEESGVTHWGLVPSEVREALLGRERSSVRLLQRDEEEDGMRVCYEELIMPLIKAVSELDGRLRYLENRFGTD